MNSFIFGGDTKDSYESLQQKRALADQLAARAGETPRNLGEGLSALGNAFASRRLTKQANKGDAAGREASSSAFQQLMGGGGAASSSYAPQSSSQPAIPSSGGDIRAGLIERGLPEHIADGFVMNMQDESGLNPGINEANPTVAGSRGGFGLYQLTGPRRVAFEKYAAQSGKNISDPNAQLDFLMTELQGTESRAAQKIFATKDAGSAADAILRDFLRPAPEHVKSRSARYLGGNAPQSGGAGGIDPKLVQMLDDPYLSKGQKSVLGMLLQQQMSANAPVNPMDAINLQKAEIELQNLQNPEAPKRDVIKGNDGFNYYQDDGSRVLPNVGEKPADPTTSQRDYEFYSAQETSAGREPLSFNQWDLQSRKAGASNTTVTTDLGNQGEFDKVTGKNLATATQDIVTAGDAAQRSLISIDRLQTALDNSPQGAAGGLASFAGNLGIKTEGSSELEVAEALISQLVPAQRPPGSGTMSDADLALFKRSLPRLINTPEGNKKIISTIRSIADYDIARGDIAAQLQFKEITASEARKAYRALANPLADLGKSSDASAGGAVSHDFTSDTPMTGLNDDDADLWKYSTPEERKVIWGSE